MEFANIQPATSADSGAITRLLQSAEFLHMHADWRLPVDWIGVPGFLLHNLPDGQVGSCLIAAADPPPAAWVRLAAFADSAEFETMFGKMLSWAETVLHKQGVDQLAWLSSADWIDQTLPHHGFTQIDEIETYMTSTLRIPDESMPAISIRPVAATDFSALAAIEVAAFAALWRHSAETLRLGWRQSATFDVVEDNGHIVAFAYSTHSHSRSAHLVRITVHPDCQGKSIGTALLKHMIAHFERHDLRFVSLNTQIGNLPSQTLYQKFGFRPTGQRYPIWAKAI